MTELDAPSSRPLAPATIGDIAEGAGTFSQASTPATFERSSGRLVTDQFRDVDSIGPRAYADFLGTEPGAAERRDAVGTTAAFGDELVQRGIALR